MQKAKIVNTKEDVNSSPKKLKEDDREWDWIRNCWKPKNPDKKPASWRLDFTH